MSFFFFKKKRKQGLVETHETINKVSDILPKTKSQRYEETSLKARNGAGLWLCSSWRCPSPSKKTIKETQDKDKRTKTKINVNNFTMKKIIVLTAQKNKQNFTNF